MRSSSAGGGSDQPCSVRPIRCGVSGVSPTAMPITHPGRFGARVGIGAIAIALSVTAVACGGDSTAEPSGTPTSVATEAAPAVTTPAPVSTVVGTATATEEATPVMPSSALPSPTPSTETVAPLETANPVADRAVGTGVSDLAPDFTLAKHDGGEITLSSLQEKGSPFLLISFTTW